METVAPLPDLRSNVPSLLPYPSGHTDQPSTAFGVGVSIGASPGSRESLGRLASDLFEWGVKAMTDTSWNQDIRKGRLDLRGTALLTCFLLTETPFLFIFTSFHTLIVQNMKYTGIHPQRLRPPARQGISLTRHRKRSGQGY